MNRTEIPEAGAETCSHLVYGKGGKSIQQRRDSLFRKWRGKNWTATCKRMTVVSPNTVRKSKYKGIWEYAQQHELLGKGKSKLPWVITSQSEQPP